jgi:hypothetical protein
MRLGDNCRSDHIKIEKCAHPVREQLLHDQRNIQPVRHNPRQERASGDRGSSDGQQQVDSLCLHHDSTSCALAVVFTSGESNPDGPSCIILRVATHGWAARTQLPVGFVVQELPWNGIAW